MKTIRYFVFVLVVALVAAVTGTAGAQVPQQCGPTEVGGFIDTDTVWDTACAPYILTSSVVVREGVTLTIEPEVVVGFGSQKALTINGALIAQGIEGEPIIFTSNQVTPTRGDWGFIHFTDTSTDATFDGNGNYTGGSIIQHAIIEYGGGADLASHDGTLRIQAASPFIDHTEIRHSPADGIHAWDNAAPRITYNHIHDNDGDGVYSRGSGIYVKSNGTLLISHNTIENNVGGTRSEDFEYQYAGGGMHVRVTDGGQAFISDNTVRNNSTYNPGSSGTSSGGGGIFVRTLSSQATLTNNEIVGNRDDARGGGIYAYAPLGQITISDNVVRDNSSSDAGGLLVETGNPGSSISVSGNVITGNSTDGFYGSGGGIQARGQYITIDNNLISENSASYTGAGLYNGGANIITNNTIISNTITNDGDFHGGGGIYASYTYGATIIGNTIRDNSAPHGGGISLWNSSWQDETTTLQNNLIVGNTASQVWGGGGIYIYPDGAVGQNHPVINQNDLYDNTAMVAGTPTRNDLTAGPDAIDAQNNYWDSTDSAQIMATIHDFFDDSSLGTVDFEPWLETSRTVGDPFVFVNGPTLISPGETVDYVVSYDSAGQAIQDAVVVMQLQKAADYVQSTGGGVFWPELGQVYWKLGNLAPHTQDLLSVKVRYEWGLPPGYTDRAMAILAGSNYGQADLDVTPYLDHQPLRLTQTTTLTRAEFDADRATYADLETLYTQAVAEGFVYGGAFRYTVSEGEPISQAVLIRQDMSAVVFLQRRSDRVLATTVGRTTYTVEDTTGGFTYDIQTDTREYFGSWQADATSLLATATCSRGTCLRNCMKEELPQEIIGGAIKSVGWVFDGIECRAGKIFSCASTIAGKFIKGTLGRFLSPIGASLDCTRDCLNDPTSNCCSNGDTLYKTRTWDTPIGIREGQACDVFDCKGQSWESRSILATICNRGEVCVSGIVKAGTSGKAGCQGCDGGGQSRVLQREDFCGLLSTSKLLGPATRLVLGETDGLPADADFDDLRRVIIDWPEQPLYQLQVAGSGASSCSPPSEVRPASDPNAKYNTPGDVIPSQLISYTIEYENVGEGIAFGVFIEDRLSEHLDESTLALDDNALFNAATRTIFWDIGELAPHGQAGSTGEVSFLVRLKDGLPSGTVVTNQAVVHFPSVPEETPTNPVVNVVQPLVAVPQSVETTYMQPVDIPLYGIDASGETPFTFEIVDEPLYGELTVFGDLTGYSAEVTYTPMENFTGLDRFTFKVDNGVSESRETEVQILVHPSADDTTPPAVSWTVPGDGTILNEVSATPVFTDSIGPIYLPSIVAAFTEPVNETTISTETISLEDGDGNSVAITVSYDGTTNQAVIALREPLQDKTQYKVVISQDVMDLIGNPMGADYVGQFSIGTEPSCDLAGNDDVITIEDIQTVAVRWRQVVGAPYDRDGDRRVTVVDLMWYVARWGGACTLAPGGDSDNVADAIPISSGQTVSGQVSAEDIDDVYKISVTADQIITIEMTGAGAGDADLYLFPPGTTDVTTDIFSDGSENVGNDEFIEGQVHEAGDWYIDVFHFEGDPVDYSVTVTLSAAVGGATEMQRPGSGDIPAVRKPGRK